MCSLKAEIINRLQAVSAMTEAIRKLNDLSDVILSVGEW
jgi:hypothetical protein